MVGVVASAVVSAVVFGSSGVVSGSAAAEVSDSDAEVDELQF